MELLGNAVRSYAWGSRSVIAELLGQPVPSPHPQAELWLGAHPGDPSRLIAIDGVTDDPPSLLDELRADPQRLLGAERAHRWDGRLPYLLKVLAAEEPLSLQAHPSAVQAAAGFAMEEAAGIGRDAAERNYRDPSHKPELICALTEFHALVGFRDAAETVRLLRELAVDELAGHVELLAGDPNQDGMRALFTTWITLPQHALDKLVPAVQDGCVRLLQRFGDQPDVVGGRYGAPGQGEYFDAEARTVLELSERYPGDAGVLAALLLNRVTLAPGEALYLAAGNLHSYLSGAGIELQANSDNVLRGGLTPKHVDVPELLRVLDFQCGPALVQRGDVHGAWTRYGTPAEEFRLSRLDWLSTGAAAGEAIPDGGGRILLCTQGASTVDCGDRSMTLHRGESLWLSAADREVTVAPETAPNQVFLATDGLEPD